MFFAEHCSWCKFITLNQWVAEIWDAIKGKAVLQHGADHSWARRILMFSWESAAVEHDLVLDSTPVRTWYWTLKSLERISFVVVLNVSMDLPKWWVSNVWLFPLARLVFSGSVINVLPSPHWWGAVGYLLWRSDAWVRTPSFRRSFGHLRTARAPSRKVSAQLVIGRNQARNSEFQVFL